MRLPLVFLAILGLLVTASGTLSAGPAPNPVLDLARAREMADDPAGAAAQLAPYVTAHPADAAAGRLLGDLYFRIPDRGRAEAAWKAVLAANPVDVTVHLRLGALDAAQNRTREAIAEYSAIMPNPAAAVALVHLHQRDGDIDTFLFETSLAADQHPFDADALLAHALVLQARRRYLEALGYFSRVVDLRHGTCSDLISRADDLLALHRDASAASDLQRCLAEDPASYDAMALLGTAELNRGDVADARGWIDRALAVDPDGFVAHVDRGVIEDGDGAWEAAINDDRAAIAAEPERPEGYANLAGDLLVRGAFAVAEATLVAGLRADPEDGRLHLLLARAYQLEDKPLAATRAEYVAALSSDEDAVVQAAKKQLQTLSR